MTSVLRYSVIALLVLFAGCQDAGNLTSHTDNVISLQWQQTNGPPADSVRTLAIVGSRLFAGTLGAGIFVSSDDGDRWSAVSSGLTNQYVLTLAAYGSNLYAGTSAGVFLSTDFGNSWSARGLSDAPVYCFARIGTYLFAGACGSGVFRSANGGWAWERTSAGLTDLTIYGLVAIDTKLYAGTFGQGVFLSIDDGASWSRTSAASTSANVYSLVVSGQYLFAGTPNALIRSTDYGITWQYMSLGRFSYFISTIAGPPTDLYIGARDSGVFHSTDAGLSWTEFNSGLLNKDVWALAASDSYLFAGTVGNAVWRRRLDTIK